MALTDEPLTKREYFAGLAMQQLLAWQMTTQERLGVDDIAKATSLFSVVLADALIGELNREKK